MIRRLHPIAGAVALACIVLFWSSTLAAELFAGHAGVAAVKTAILWGMGVLIPAMALVGASGFRLGGRAQTPRIRAKKRRMPIIALNGLCVLVPCAIFLQARASAGLFDTTFALVQAVELVAGAINITLMGLSMRDGFALARGRRPAPI